MRLTKERHPKTGKLISGVRKCDVCGKEEFIAKPKRWDICICCLRKELYASGKNLPPKPIKKQSYINYCVECNKVFEIKSRALRHQPHCSSKCAGVKMKGRPPANKVWDDRSERNKHYYNKYRKDDNFVARINIRTRIKSAIRTACDRKKQKYIQIGDLERFIGCTMEELKLHIESQFQEGMHWGNWNKKGWHLDHIYPLSLVDCTDEEELKKVCNYKNLQPLWASENHKKHNKVVRELEDILGQ
jgi:hypothetical protein